VREGGCKYRVRDKFKPPFTQVKPLEDPPARLQAVELGSSKRATPSTQGEGLKPLNVRGARIRRRAIPTGRRLKDPTDLVSVRGH